MQLDFRRLFMLGSKSALAIAASLLLSGYASISTPRNGSVVSGVVTVTALAQPGDRFRRDQVELYVDGVKRGVDRGTPYTFAWDARQVLDGQHILVVRAYSLKLRRQVYSPAVTVIVRNQIDSSAPSVTITAPSNSALVSGSVTISASASDNVGVAAVQFLLDGANLGAADATSPYTITWNTVTAANGTHSLAARARDATGNVTTSSVVSLTVDNAAPTQPPAVALDGATISSLQATWSAATDNVAVAGYRLDLSTTDSFSSFVSGYQNLDVGNVTGLNLTSLSADTTYYLRVRAYDAVGNTSTDSPIAYASTLAPPDTTAPVASLSAIPAGPNFDSAQTVTLTADASDNVGVTRVEFYDGSTLVSAGTISPYTCSWNVTSADNGAHSWNARAYDAAGNAATSSILVLSVNIDVTPPTVSLSANPVGSTYTVPQVITLTADAADNNTVSRVEFYDGEALRSTATTAPYTYSFTVSASDNGLHSWTARAYDAAGNAATSSALALVIDIDATPPTVSLTAPSNGALISSSNVTVSADASDNVGVAAVQFLLDGANLGAADATSPYTMVWDSASVADGPHTLQAVAIDRAGNNASSASIAVTVNNAPQAAGVQLYVDGACPASGNGSSLTCGVSGPFRTISEGILAMQPGTTLNVRGAHGGFDGVYFESLTIQNNASLPGKALACTADQRCVIQGYASEQPIVRGMTRRSDWMDQGGGVYSRTMETSPNPYGVPVLSRDEFDPMMLMQGTETPLTPLGYAGDSVTAPSEGHWSYDPTTNQIFVNPIGTDSPVATVYVPHFGYNVHMFSPTKYVTLDHLTFEGTRGPTIHVEAASSSGANPVAGVMLRHLIMRYSPRYFVLTARAAPGLVIEDSLGEYGMRGYSWAAPSNDGFFGFRLFCIHGGTVRRNTIRHIGATGRVRLSGGNAWRCPWCDAPWDDPNYTQNSSSGIAYQIKQSEGVLLEGNSAEDISTGGISLDVSRHVTVQGNTVHRALMGADIWNFTPTGGCPTTDPLQFCYNSDHVIRANVFDEIGYTDMTGCGIGVVAGSERHDGAVMLAQIYNNVISRVGFAGFCVQNGGSMRGGSTTPTADLSIWHNTVYGARNVSGAQASRGIVIRNETQNVIVRNNVFDGLTSDGLVITAAAAGGLSLDGDVLGTIAGCQVRWNVPAFSSLPSGGTCDTLQNFTTMTLQESHGRTGALNFTDVNAVPPDLHLTANSAAIDAGVDLPDVPTDLDGDTRPQGSGWDAGADEWIR